MKALEIVVQAPHMKTRVLATRERIVQNHIVPQVEYPVADLLHSSSLLPLNKGALAALLRRRALAINGLTMTNEIGRVVDAHFAPVINGTPFRVAVRFPQPLSIVAQVEPPLTLTMATPLEITFLERPAVPDASLLPETCALIRVRVGDESLIYEFGALGSPHSSSADVLFRIVAQFDKLPIAGSDSHEKLKLSFHGFCGGPTTTPPPNVEGGWRGTATSDSAGSRPQPIYIAISCQTPQGQFKWRAGVLSGDGSVSSDLTVFMANSDPDFRDRYDGKVEGGGSKIKGRWTTTTLTTVRDRGDFEVSRVHDSQQCDVVAYSADPSSE